MKFIIILLFIQNSLCDLDTNWWKHTTIYEIYIWSFKDSNGDGIGDLKGVTLMLDHFVDLKIDTLYLTPFYASPMDDMGYDISNFTEIDPRFGTMSDFEELIREMTKRGMKLLIDLVLNHSSDEHLWFKKSVAGIHPYSDYYVWRNAKGFNNGKPIPPNNWMSVFKGIGWEWSNVRNQFYYHQFSAKQPDLNLRNEVLRNEIKKILEFWLKKGVAGMRLDATKHFIEDELFRDEPPINSHIKRIEKHDDLLHIYTLDLWESYEFIHDVLRSVIDKFSQKKENFERILIAESYSDLKHVMAYYGKKNNPIIHFPFNFQFIGLKTFLNATGFKNQIHYWLDNMPKGATANWVTENHDNLRIGNQLNEEYMDILIITTMMVPGVACLYYGQEIGMTGIPIRDDQKVDKGGGFGLNRDSERLPMQWDNSMNAGFTSKNRPWLPVNPNYWTINVEAQKNIKTSRYNLIKNLSEIRKTKTLKNGEMKSYIISTWIYAFTRTYKGHETYLTLLNLGSETETFNLHAVILNLSSMMEIVASSINSGYIKGSRMKSFPKFPRMFTMRPFSAIVLKTVRENVGLLS